MDNYKRPYELSVWKSILRKQLTSPLGDRANLFHYSVLTDGEIVPYSFEPLPSRIDGAEAQYIVYDGTAPQNKYKAQLRYFSNLYRQHNLNVDTLFENWDALTPADKDTLVELLNTTGNAINNSEEVDKTSYVRGPIDGYVLTSDLEPIVGKEYFIYNEAEERFVLYTGTIFRGQTIYEIYLGNDTPVIAGYAVTSQDIENLRIQLGLEDNEETSPAVISLEQLESLSQQYQPLPIDGYIHCVYSDDKLSIIDFTPEELDTTNNLVTASDQLNANYIGIIIDQNSTSEYNSSDYSVGDYMWYPLFNEWFDDEKQVVIGASDMTSKSRAQNIQLHTNINGMNELTFDLYTHYFDEYEDDFIENPFVKYDVGLITNESKLKLCIYNSDETTTWYDFIVKNIDRSNTEHKISYQATDAFIYELSRNGYNVLLATDLNNNSGTAYENAQRVVNDSTWAVSEQSEPIHQFITESLLKYEVSEITMSEQGDPGIKLTAPYIFSETMPSIYSHIGDIWYVFYSVCINKPTYFQFIYHTPNEDDTPEYMVDSDNIIIETKDNGYYGGWCFENVEYVQSEGNDEDVLIIQTSNYTIKLVPDNTSRVSDMRGQRIVRQPKTVYDPLIERLVNVYKYEADTYYGYVDTTFLAPNYSPNFVVNGNNFTTPEGWTIADANSSVTVEYIPRANWVQCDDKQVALKKKADTYTSKSKGEFLVLDPHNNAWIYNDMCNNLGNYYDTIPVGTQLLLRIQGGHCHITPHEDNHYNHYDFGYSDMQEFDTIQFAIKGYTFKDDFTRIPDGQDYFEFTKFQKDEYSFKINYNIIDEASFNSAKSAKSIYTYEFTDNTERYKLVTDSDSYDSRQTYYSKEDNCYIATLTCTQAISSKMLEENNLGLFIKLPTYTAPADDNSYGWWFKKIEISSLVETTLTIQNESSTEHVKHYYTVGEYIPAKTLQTQYYYKADNNYLLPEQIEYADNSLSYTTVYNNFEKIKSIEAGESNYYNILQDIAETYECWIRFEINRDKFGDIQLVNWKKVWVDQFNRDVQYYTYNDSLDIYQPVNIYELIPDDAAYDEKQEYYIFDGDKKIYSPHSIIDGYQILQIANSTEFYDELAKSKIYYINQAGVFSTTSEYKENTLYYRHNYDYEKYNNNETFYGIRKPEYDTQYYIYTPKRQDKNIVLKNYFDIFNYTGFRYGINLQNITRTINSDAIASKLLVMQNSNESAEHGYCAIADASDNPTRQNFIYNFDYYVQSGLLSLNQLNQDLYGDTGYYTQLNALLAPYHTYSEAVAAAESQLIPVSSEIDTLKLTVSNLQNLLTEEYSYFPGSNRTVSINTPQYDFTYEEAIAKKVITSTNITTNQIKQQVNDATSAVSKSLSKIQTWTEQYKTYQAQLVKQNQTALDLKNTITNSKLLINDILQKQQQLNKDFEIKYNRFIQEGTWIDEEQLDANSYYYDACGVLATSKSPELSYNFNVIDISQLEDFEAYNFQTGERTYVYDPEFFGDSKEEVLISAIVYDLDHPQNTQITVQNFRSTFEDLFQRISATIQSLEYKEGGYRRAASAFTTGGTLDADVLQDTLDASDLNLLNTPNVKIDASGVYVYDTTSMGNIVRLAPGGVYLTNDGGATWRQAINSDGLSVKELSAGLISTNDIVIQGNNGAAFQWDALGINAYDTSNGYTDYTKFVRLDQYGIYGVEEDKYYLIPTDERPDVFDETIEYYELDENDNYNIVDIYRFVPGDTLPIGGTCYYWGGEDQGYIQTSALIEGVYYYYIGSDESGEIIIESQLKSNPNYHGDLYLKDWSTWTPNLTSGDSSYQQIKDHAIFGLTYDGFFLKSKHDEGYVEISDQNDIKVLQYNNDDEVTRIEIGLLDEYGTSYEITADNIYEYHEYYSEADRPTSIGNDNYYSQDSFDIQPNTYYTIKSNKSDITVTAYYYKMVAETDSAGTISYIPSQIDVWTQGYIYLETDPQDINNEYYVILGFQNITDDLIISIYQEQYDAGGQYGIRINDKNGAPVMESTDDGTLWLKQILRVGPDYYNDNKDRVKIGTIAQYAADGTPASKEISADYTKVLSVQGDVTPMSNHPTEINETLAIFDDGFLYAQNAYLEGEIKAQSGYIGSLIIDPPGTIDAGIHSADYGAGEEGFLLKYDGSAVFNNATIRTDLLKVNNYRTQDNIEIFGVSGNTNSGDSQSYTKINIGTDLSNMGNPLNGMTITSGSLSWIEATGINHSNYDINTTYYYLNETQYYQIPLMNSNIATLPIDNTKLFMWDGTKFIETTDTNQQVFWYDLISYTGNIYTAKPGIWTNALNLQSDNAFFLYQDPSSTAKATLGLVSMKNIGTNIGTQAIYNTIRWSRIQYDNRADLLEQLGNGDELGDFLWECRDSDGHLTLKLV